MRAWDTPRTRIEHEDTITADNTSGGGGRIAAIHVTKTTTILEISLSHGRENEHESALSSESPLRGSFFSEFFCCCLSASRRARLDRRAILGVIFSALAHQKEESKGGGHRRFYRNFLKRSSKRSLAGAVFCFPPFFVSFRTAAVCFPLASRYNDSLSRRLVAPVVVGTVVGTLVGLGSTWRAFPVAIDGLSSQLDHTKPTEEDYRRPASCDKLRSCSF